MSANAQMTYQMENREIVSFTYHYVDGDTLKIEMSGLSEELREELKEMKRLEYNCEQRERRRHCAFITAANRGAFKDDGTTKRLPVEEPVFDEAVRREKKAGVHKAIKLLTPDQQTLIKQIYFSEIPAVKIAKDSGVSKSAISHRLNRALSQLRKNVA